MSSDAGRTPTFIVVCRFREGTDMTEVFGLAREEAARAAELQATGHLGAIHLSLVRGTVFFEVHAEDAGRGEDIIRSLPMARWWDLDMYPIARPEIPGGAS